MKARKTKEPALAEELAKATNADLTSNLTGGQIQEVLDFLIYESLAPLVKTSDVFDVQIVYLLGLTARNRKRKLSALPREEFMTSLCHCLITDDRDKKIHILTNSKIERGFVYNFVVKFLKETEGYAELYQRYLLATGHERIMLDMKLRALEQNVGNSRSRLFSTINIAQDYLELAYEFRNSIVSNYVKLAYKQAKAFCKMKGENFDFKDVYHNFLTAITKAVDKYDCTKGALTSYINYWVLNAQTCSNTDHGHEYGIAYSIPQMQRKQMAQGTNSSGDVNFSVSLDKLVSSDSGEDGATSLQDYIVGDVGAEVKLEQRQEMEVVRYLAKCADIRSLARLYLDIDEVFSKKELRLMRKTMREQQLLKTPAVKPKKRLKKNGKHPTQS
jgi:hypothetical protein